MPDLQPTALLRHVTDNGEHYDWLIARPGEDRLWTARVAEPSSRWVELGQWELQVIPPHRKVYLTYEGPVSGGRGTVERVDSGEVRIETWTDDAAVLAVSMRHFCGKLLLTRETADRWHASVS